MNRVRRLQGICRESQEFSSLLFVCGVDGKFNWGGTCALRYLLQTHSPRDLVNRAAEGTSVDWGPTESHEALDETFILITRHSVFVFVDNGALSLLQPLLSFWASGDVGLQIAHGGEDRKIFEFKNAVLTHLAPNETVGVPFPVGVESSSGLESWPLLASFALDDAGTEFGDVGPCGFFTVRHPVVEASAALVDVIKCVDATVVRKCMSSSMTSFREHWLMTAKGMARFGGRDGLTESACVEHLSLLFDYGKAAIGGACSSAPPRALFGLRSELIASPSSDLPSQDTHPCGTSYQAIIEGSEPHSGAQACRTFFLASSKGGAVARLAEVYLRLARALHFAAAGTVLPSVKHLGLPSMVGLLRERVVEFMGEEELDIRVVVTLTNALGDAWICDGSASSGVYPSSAPSFMYVRVSAHGLQLSGEALGAVAVGDTFITECDHGDVTKESLAVAGGLLQSGQGGLITGGGCAPYCAALASASDSTFKVLSQAIRNTHTVRDELLLGRQLETVGDISVLLETSLLQWDGPVVGQLRLYDCGFAVLNSGLAPFAVSFERVSAARVVPFPGDTAILLLALAPASDEAAQNPLEDALPFVQSASHLALVLPADSSQKHAVLRAFPKWRRVATESAAGSAHAFGADVAVPPRFIRAVADLSPISLRKGTIDALFTACTASDAQEVLGGSEAAVEEGRGVALLLGLPGSSVAQIAATIQLLCPDESRVSLVFTLAEGHRAMGDIEQALDLLVRSSAPHQRLMLAVSSSMSAASLCRIVATQKGLSVASLSVCVGCAGAFTRPFRAPTFSQLNPKLLAQCASGFASTVMLVDAAAFEKDASSFVAALAKSNPKALVARVSRGHVGTSAIDSILDPGSFDRSEPSRTEHLCRGWRSARHSPPPSTGAALSVRVDVPLCPERLLRILAKIFPAAKVRLPPVAVRASQWAVPSARPSGVSGRGVRCLWQLAAAKVFEDRAGVAGLADLDSALRQELKEPLDLTGVAGVVMVNTDVMVVDGNAAAVAASVQSPTMLVTSPNMLTFTAGHAAASPEAQADATNCLERLLALAVAAKPNVVGLRASLGPAEAALAEEVLTHAPLPQGWQFDGNFYVNFEGHRLRSRPDHDELAANWLLHENARLGYWSSLAPLISRE